MQQALVGFTNVPVSDQIVMFGGARLDPTKTLASYKLPVVSTMTLPPHSSPLSPHILQPSTCIGMLCNCNSSLCVVCVCVSL